MAEQHTTTIRLPARGWVSLNAPGPITRAVSSDPPLRLGQDIELDQRRGLVRVLRPELAGGLVAVTVEVDSSLSDTAQQAELEALIQQLQGDAPAALARLDGILTEPWPVLPSEVRERVIRDVRWLARHQRRLFLLVARILLNWRPTSDEAPPEPQ